MGLLAPLFLLGLAGLVVPIVVHLTERQRREVVDFPSLMFLRKIPFRSSRRKKIHHWALLAVRTLALALLVAAFSRPFFENDVRGIGTTLGPREVVVVLDRSYSMGYGDRWERAKTQARQVFEGLDVQDRASLVLMSKGAEALLRATSDQDRLLAGLNETDLSADSIRPGPEVGPDDPGRVPATEPGGRHHQRLPTFRVERRRGRGLSSWNAGEPCADFR